MVPSFTAPPVPQARFNSAHNSFNSASLSGRPSTTVTVLPPRPAFSMRSLATSLSGTVCCPLAERHLQLIAGHPHFGQTAPVAVEKTRRELDLSLMGRSLTRPVLLTDCHASSWRT